MQSSSLQFGPKHRLVKAEQFDRVFKKNYRSRDQYFVVLARRNHLTYARLGLAVSRKAAGDAVPRNRLKRLIRETFRGQLPDCPGLDCVVMANNGAAKKSNDTLISSLNKHWARVSKRCKN